MLKVACNAPPPRTTSQDRTLRARPRYGEVAPHLESDEDETFLDEEEDDCGVGVGGDGDGDNDCMGEAMKESMPFLFDMWDVDSSGSLDRSEVILGIARKFRHLRLPMTNQNIQRINSVLSEVDLDHNDQLDRKEFGCFLLRLASSMGISLDKLAASLSDDSRNFKAQGWDKVPILFSQWDADESGKISIHELSVALRKIPLKITYEECMSLMDEVDGDDDREMDSKEFTKFLARFSLASGIPLIEATEFLLKETKETRDADLSLEGWKMLPMLFDAWDADGDGVIVRIELIAGIGQLINDLGLHVSLPQVYEILDEADLNRDHELDRREFGLFLSRFAVLANLTLNEVTYYLMKAHRRRVPAAAAPTAAPEQATADTNRTDLKGWADMDRLFEMWDINNDGIIDREELTIGIDSFRSSGKSNISAISYLQILEEVDSNNDRVLDPREFSAFLGRFAPAAGIPLDELTKYLMEECCPARIEEKLQTRGGFGWKFLVAWTGTRMAEESLETMRYVEANPSRRASACFSTYVEARVSRRASA